MLMLKVRHVLNVKHATKSVRVITGMPSCITTYNYSVAQKTRQLNCFP